MKQQQPIFNEHNKTEFPPAHTAEHLLNQTMIRLFNCGRAVNAHIEEKKSKCDYSLPKEPTPDEILKIESMINDVIKNDMTISFELISKDEAIKKYNLSKLPQDASDTLRIVHIGDYDACPCIGLHVNSTKEIGSFKILSSSYSDGIWRVRWKTVKI